MKIEDGLWKALKAEMSGNDITAYFAEEEMEIADNRYQILMKGVVKDSGDLIYYSGSSALDILGTGGPNKGKLFKCIYKLDTEKLVICYSQADRPLDYLATAENQFVLITWIKK